MTVDLHLSKEILNSPFYDPRNSLNIQMDIFEKEIDKALVMGLNEITVIHGIGEGVLKREIQKVSKQHPHILSTSNDYHPLYGMGSTKIIFK